MKRAKRVDIGALRPVKRRADGTIVADALLTRCGVFEYDTLDGMRRELRLPDEVFKPESLESFAQVPVTDDHPPVMLDSENALDYARGATGSSVVPDDDHVRSTIAVFDAGLIRKMNDGKLQISNGYTCDLDETPGVHPVYGAYDAIQKNIVGNHVAVVDMGRAGTARVRMDGAGMMVRHDVVSVEPEKISGTVVASRKTRATISKMAIRAKSKQDDAQPSASAVVDPDDMASRNAAGDNDAPVDDSMDPDDDDFDPDDEDCDDDAYDMSYEDGVLTAAARSKIASSNFAVPETEQLPIHDKPHTRAAMSRFGQTDFPSTGDKHAAFNRIKGRAKQFGISTKGFEKAHAGKLDKKDKKMTDLEKKAAEKVAKKAAREAEIAKLTARADAADKAIEKLTGDLAARDGQIDSLKKDVETAKAAQATAEAARSDSSDDRVQARVELITKAATTGAKFDSKSNDRAIKLAVLTHVDKIDPKTLESKHDQYVDALFDGACTRATGTSNQLSQLASLVASNHAADADKAGGVRVDSNGGAKSADGLDDESTAHQKFMNRNRSYDGRTYTENK